MPLSKLSQIREITQNEKEAYNNLVSHPIQSWEWGEFRQKFGSKVVRLGVFENDKPTAAFQVFFRKIFKFPWTIGNLSKGILPEKEIVEKLKEIAEKEKAVFVKIEPDIVVRRWKNIKGEIKIPVSQETTIDLKELGLFPAKKPLFSRFSFILDIKKSEEDLLLEMVKRTRYNIHLAQDHGVVVEEKSNEEGMEEFIWLFQETQKRGKFYMHSAKYFRQMWQILGSAGIIRILLAKYQGHVLNAKILFFWKNRLFCPYGASSRQFASLKAANLIYWEIIRLGKKLGCESFDMWASLGPEPEPKHTWYGFHQFKAGYGADLVEYAGSWDLVNNKFLYEGFHLADSVRWVLLKLKR